MISRFMLFVDSSDSTPLVKQQAALTTLLHMARFTMNAFYYNVATQQIEDWSGRAVSDLQNGIVRSLVSTSSLSVRSVNFIVACRLAAEYGFHIHENIIEAMQHPTAHEELRTKANPISRTKELERIFTSTFPHIALATLGFTGLHKVLLVDGLC
jgi:tRNA nucleotidyltransferase (CCA-adding enzyme)